MAEGTAAREIEETIRINRVALDRSIAFYRLILYALAFVSTFGMRMAETLAGRHTFWLPPVYFSTAAAVSVVLYVNARRSASRTARPVLLYATPILDMIAISGLFPLFRIFPPPDLELVPFFVRTLVAPTLVFIMFIHALRQHRPSSIVASIAAIGIYAFVVGATLPRNLWERDLFVGAVVLLAAGVVSSAASGQARKSLETFARYQALQRYLPAEVVRRVVEHRDPTAMDIGGRVSVLTMLSSDLRGFTTLSEKLAPEELVRQLNEYHAAMHDCIDRHQGTLDKFIGDGALAVFGLLGNPSDAGASDAIACARSMIDALAKLNERRAAEGLAPLAMGIGIHTGSVVAGNIGSPGRRIEFTLIGDAVNTTARLEGLTKELKVGTVISADTVGRLQQKEGLRSLGSTAVRGRTEGVEVFTLG